MPKPNYRFERYKTEQAKKKKKEEKLLKKQARREDEIPPESPDALDTPDPVTEK